MEKLLSELTRILYLHRAVGFSRVERFNLAPKKGFHISFFMLEITPWPWGEGEHFPSRLREKHKRWNLKRGKRERKKKKEKDKG